MKITLFIMPILVAMLYCDQLAAHDRKFVSPPPRTLTAEFSIKHLGSDDGHQPLFEGFKDSVGIESGRVLMSKGQKGERHSTEIYEEVLLILKGSGSIEVEGKKFEIGEGDVVYIPPHHVHQLTSKGKNLEYVYVAAPTFLPFPFELQPSKLKSQQKDSHKKSPSKK